MQNLLMEVCVCTYIYVSASDPNLDQLFYKKQRKHYKIIVLKHIHIKMLERF